MKTLVAVLIGSTMVLSFGADAMTCSELWSANPQSKSESFIRISQTQPELTDEVKTESVQLCESAAKAARNGVPAEAILAEVNRSSRGLPEEGRVSMAFMAMGGWQIGKMGE